MMVGLGLLMATAGIAGLVVRLRGRLWRARWLHKLMVLMAPAGFIAMLAGWVVTEAGRQPWTVYGLLRTDESASPIAPGLLLGSLAATVTVYLLLFSLGLWFLLRLLAHPPQSDEESAMPEVAQRTGRGADE
jgi:Cytochrome bd-type quinol oxidase, subunit 1